MQNTNRANRPNRSKSANRQAQRLGLLLGTLLSLASLSNAQAASQTRTSAFAYDSGTGLLTKEIVEPDSSAHCLVTEYGIDTYGNKTSATTRNCNGSAGETGAPSGDPVFITRSHSSSMDSRGQFPLSSTNALNQSETKTYDPKTGAILTLTGPNGLTTTWQYDSFGRKTLEIRADGNRTKWDYLYCTGVNGGAASCPTVGGAAGAYLIQVTPQTSAGAQSGPLSKTYYDALDREIRSETQGYDGSGASTAIYKDTQYDHLGRPYKTSRPYYTGQTAYWITLGYDALGRVISDTQADGNVSTTAYNGLTVTVTNPKSQTRTTVKNSQGQVASVTDTNNKTITYRYDPFGNLTQTQDALGNLITNGYDLRGRKTSMQDPDMGTWTYAYNALGELIRQIDAKGQTSSMVYDKLGRLTNRSEADLISTWTYDSCSKGIGKLCQASSDNGYKRVTSYDSLGRTSQIVDTNGSDYTLSLTYDSHGRVATQNYPNGFATKNVYTTLGYLKEVRNQSTNALYWQANTRDAEGHLLQQTYGNNVVTQQTYNASNGRLTSIIAGAGNAVQNLSYQYDALGNITNRSDSNQNLSETFGYDSLNRLTTSTVNASGAGIITKTYTYDELGNLKSRSDLGSYVYNASGANSIRPHAVAQINDSAGGKRVYNYDPNGNLTSEVQYDAANNLISAKGRTEEYTSYNMAKTLATPGATITFTYGPEHQRVSQGAPNKSVVYLHPDNSGGLWYEKDIKWNLTGTDERYFIQAGGHTVAIVKQARDMWGNPTGTTTQYLHHDNLNSVTAITDASGNVSERLAYEPFGKRRFISGANDSNNAIQGINTNRGFTEHEELDAVGLIHMNGRVYDPMIGRFVSADPYIQSPSDLQSYNRYSYTLNNPLMYTDPTGYWNAGKAFAALLAPITNREVFRTAVSIAAAYYVGNVWAPFGSSTASLAASFGNGAAGGFTGSFIGSGGDFKAALYGGFQGGLFGAIGFQADAANGNWGDFAKVSAHAGAGCLSSAVAGGSCGSGALAAGFGKYATQNMPGFIKDNQAYQLAYIAAVGGTASVLGGGKFANGALSSAYALMFNQWSQALKLVQGLTGLANRLAMSPVGMTVTEMLAAEAGVVGPRVNGVAVRTYDELIEVATDVGKLERGKTGWITQNALVGNADEIFSRITQGGQVTSGGGYQIGEAKMYMHTAKSTGQSTIDINTGARIYKIRIEPDMANQIPR